MTVKELIEELGKYSPEDQVYVFGFGALSMLQGIDEAGIKLVELYSTDNEP